MPTTVQHSYFARNRWVLPAVLVLLILGLVLGVLFGSRLKNASSNSTATPQVVTATPNGAAATPNSGAAVAASATPGGKGASTPLPHSTPVPTVAGLSLGMKTYSQTQVQKIQSAADANDPAAAYHLDPTQAVNKDLPHYGFTNAFQIVSPTKSSPTPTPVTDPGDPRPVVHYVVSYQGKQYKVAVAQPGKTGPKGIWLIVTILQA